MKRSLFTVLTVAASATLLPAQEADPADVATLDDIIRAYYEVVSKPAGQAIDTRRDLTIHHPGAMVTLVNRGADGVPTAEIVPIAEYHRRAGPGMLDVAFFEWEVSREVQSFGAITHVWSTYAWSDSPNGPVRGRGINSIQLLHDGTRWWILHWLYDSETQQLRIPDQYLD